MMRGSVTYCYGRQSNGIVKFGRNNKDKRRSELGRGSEEYNKREAERQRQEQERRSREQEERMRRRMAWPLMGYARRLLCRAGGRQIFPEPLLSRYLDHTAKQHLDLGDLHPGLGCYLLRRSAN